MTGNLRIGIIGDYDETFVSHRQMDSALRHAATALGTEVTAQWLATNQSHDLTRFAGLWCAPGSPYKNLEGALLGNRFARQSGTPLLGTCGGFQHVVLEYGRNVLGFEDAAHAEYDPYASRMFVQPLSCSLKGKCLPIQIQIGSRAAESYGRLSAGRELLL